MTRRRPGVAAGTSNAAALAGLAALALGALLSGCSGDGEGPGADTTLTASQTATLPLTAPTSQPTAFDATALTELDAEGVQQVAATTETLLTLDADGVTGWTFPDLRRAWTLAPAPEGDVPAGITPAWSDLRVVDGVGYVVQVAHAAGEGTRVGTDNVTVTAFDPDAGEVLGSAGAAVSPSAKAPPIAPTARVAAVAGATVVVDLAVPGVSAAHTTVTFQPAEERVLWDRVGVQPLAVSRGVLLAATGYAGSPGPLRGLDLATGSTAWDSLPDTEDVAAVGVDDLQGLVARSTDAGRTVLTPVSLLSGVAGPERETTTWDWRCTPADPRRTGDVVCSLGDTGALVGWEVRPNLARWLLPTGRRYAPSVSLVSEGYVYGALADGREVTLDALTGRDVASGGLPAGASGPVAVNRYAAIFLAGGRVSVAPRLDGDPASVVSPSAG